MSARTYVITLAIVLVIVLLASGLGWAGVLNAEQIVAIYTAVLGYLFGRVHGAAEQYVNAKKDEEQRQRNR